MECPTCAERGYDNADYHRLHRAWCDSVAEIERLRAALGDAKDLAEADGPAHMIIDVCDRALALASQASSS
jgi:hypothetical protein